jgi:integrase/recombinase XerD
MCIVTGTWDELADRYVEWLERAGRRPHTVRGYRADLADLVRVLGDDAAGRIGVAGWVDSLEGLAPATRARRFSAARGFLRWAASQGAEVTGADLLDQRAGRLPQRPVAAPDPAAVEAALASIPRQADRDQLLFKLIALAGLRPGEALAVHAEDFDASSGHLAVRGWGGRSRLVLIDDPELQLRLTHWLRATVRSTGPLFCAPGRSTPLRYQSLRERWERYTAQAGVELGLGELRLHHAAQLLAGGVPEWVVRDRLGQPTGPLPTPPAASADEAIRAWRQRQAPAQPTRSAKRDRNRRDAG